LLRRVPAAAARNQADCRVAAFRENLRQHCAGDMAIFGLERLASTKGFFPILPGYGPIVGMEPAGPARPEGLLFEAGTKKTQRSDVSRRNGCEMVYGVVMTVFTAAASEGKPCVAMKKLWSYILRYMRPAISAALGPKVGRPPCRKTTTTTRPTLVLA
jgi:hypothetical protein